MNSWVNKDDELFGDLLKKNKVIKKFCDIEYFVYETNIFNNPFRSIKNFIHSLISGKTKKDLSIESCADMLFTKIQHRFKEYNNIFIIAHSMGGLIAKDCIIRDIKQEKKIKLYFSLAVPYQGSDLARYGIFRSKQTKGLKPLQDYTNNLTSEWIKVDEKDLPQTFYFIGKNDVIVNENSAISFDKREIIPIYTNEDHKSISKPNKDSDVYKVIESNIIESLRKINQLNELMIDNFKDDGQFDNMLFFIKLVISDITDSMRKSSKKSFYKIDYLLRTLSKKEQNELNSLKAKIEDLYLEKFSKLESGDIKNSNQLINEIKETMRTEDSNTLKHTNKLIEHIHKFGLLHHSANKEEENIWWGLEQSMKDIESYNRGNHE